MPASIKCITEHHFFFVKGTLTYFAAAWGILGGGAAEGVEEGWYGRERMWLGFQESEIELSR